MSAVSILRVRIELEDLPWEVWREIEIPAGGTFWDLHVAIQDSMGWDESHLHRFSVPGRVNEIPLVGPRPDAVSGFREWETRLEPYLATIPSRFQYEYDFGDSWQHQVVVHSRVELGSGASCPRCVAGSGRCPPENSGGAPFYAMLVEAHSAPEGTEHEMAVRFLGESFDPQEFDASSVEFSDPQGTPSSRGSGRTAELGFAADDHSGAYWV